MRHPQAAAWRVRGLVEQHGLIVEPDLLQAAWN
jgi:hypothetical protein